MQSRNNYYVPTDLTCKHCGKTYRAESPNKLYCRLSCKNAAQKARECGKMKGDAPRIQRGTATSTAQEGTADPG